MGLDTNLITGF